MFNIPQFTVSEFSSAIKHIVEDAFGYVKISGEISGFKQASSGHLYFNLKDDNAVLSAVCFRSSAVLVDFEIGDGLQVCALGRITTYEGRSNYQIVVEKVEVAGVGAILEMIEKRRQKLLAEGLFDAVHKKPIPFFPKIVGIITSETGAVIEDIKHRIEDRCPSHVMIYPSAVQGEKAAAGIIAGIKFFNKLKTNQPDVLIIARGGGSFEDLLPFSDENLVREVFKSKIPVISAIGHETDITLIDYVADLRAPTPTAAAELATPLLSDLKSRLEFLSGKLQFLPRNFREQNFLRLENLQRYIIDPEKMLTQINERFCLFAKEFDLLTGNFFERRSEKLRAMPISVQAFLQKADSEKRKIEFISRSMESVTRHYLLQEESNLINLTKLLKSNHYHEILKRGFALIKNENGDLISSIAKARAKENLVIEMADGESKFAIKAL